MNHRPLAPAACASVERKVLGGAVRKSLSQLWGPFLRSGEINPGSETECIGEAFIRALAVPGRCTPGVVRRTMPARTQRCQSHVDVTQADSTGAANRAAYELIRTQCLFSVEEQQHYARAVVEGAGRSRGK